MARIISPMPTTSSSPLPGTLARTAGRGWLRDALQATRHRTLALHDAYQRALADRNFQVPLAAELNPPLWELGHIGWFQDWWIARNPQRALGVTCNPDYTRTPSRLSGADAFYDSSNVPHDSRWSLPLPDAAGTHRYLREGLADTLALLDASAEDDASLYFFRLVLLHEDMHGEAAVYMAQSLGLPVPEEIAFPRRRGVTAACGNEAGAGNIARHSSIRLSACDWQLGSASGPDSGFAFDNELMMQAVALPAFEIDAAPVTWARYLPFVEASGYGAPQWWTPEGWAWRTSAGMPLPRYLRRQDGEWQQQTFGVWHALNLSAPATHLTLHEAAAWCRWAGRRLPTEAEWECASGNAAMHWGDVWEWTADRFLPFPGFAPHPYRDYSAPWFGTRQVLRGASRATAANVMHAKYRNFFPPERNDIYSGFRSCAAG